MGWWNSKANNDHHTYRAFDIRKLDVKSYRQSDGFQFKNIAVPSRSEAMEYVPFARCIDLLITSAAEIVTSSLRIVDRDNNEVNSNASTRILDLLRETPDDFQSADTFIRSVMSDMLVDGNALVHFNTRGAMSLTRLNAADANTMLADSKMGLAGLVYHAHPFGFSRQEMYPAREVVHAHYAPQASDFISDGRRQFFSESALSMLRKAIFIGKAADSWVGDFFDDAAKNNIAIMLPEMMDAELQKKQIQAFEMTQTNKRSPLVLFGGAQVKVIDTTPQDAEALALREYGVQEIGRFYGVPAPLINVNTTQWGSGIEHLARLHYRYGTRLHLSKFLDAFSFRMLPAGQRFEVDSTQEVKGDMTALSTFISAVRPSTNNPGLMSRDEVRKVVGAYGVYEDDWGDWEPSTKQNDVVQSAQGSPRRRNTNDG